MIGSFVLRAEIECYDVVVLLVYQGRPSNFAGLPRLTREAPYPITPWRPFKYQPNLQPKLHEMKKS